MANRYANLVGTKKISEDFYNINTGFDKVQAEMDTNKGTADTHINNADIHVTAAKKAEWDAKAPGSTQVDLKAHTDNADIHVTKAKKEEWDSKAPGSTATDLVNHKADKVVHVTQDDHDKLDGIEEGAQVNQNAFAKVNDIEAANPSSRLYIVEGIGIRVTTNPNTGEITITATGDAAPGAHGPTHTEFGADPIPTATLTEGGLLSAAQFAEIVAHGELLEEYAEALNTLEDRLDIEQRQDVVLNAGIQILNAQRRAAFSLSGIKGRTLANLLGRDGNCENVSRFTPWQATLAAETVDKTQGNQSLKITTTAAPGGSGALTGFPVKEGSYYLIVADVKLESGTSTGAYLNGIADSKGNTNSTDTTKFKTVWKAYSVSVAATVYAVGEVIGPSGSVGYVDAFRVYEINATQYAALDSMTPEQIGSKYPYVDSVQPVRNPYAFRYGENLLPPFYEWETTTGTNDAPYVHTITAPSSTSVSAVYKFKPIAGQTYTYSVDGRGGGRIGLDFRDSGGNILKSSGWVDNDSITLDAPSGSEVVQVFASSGGQIGTFTFKNPMLTLGTVAKPFKPREDSMLALQTDLYADPLTGGNADEVFEKDGQYFKLMKWKKVVLDDSISGLGTTGFTGFKVAVMNMISGASSSDMVTKYDGKVLSKKTTAFTTGDMAALEIDSKLRISIFNIDSGWGDSYTPTPDEIKAYFMGYKMYSGTPGTPYNGSGTKSFGKRGIDGNIYWVQDTIAPTVTYSEWTPYQLVYQLATPTVEPIVSEGMLTFHEGDNQIEVGTGIVVRESVKPFQNPSSGNTVINSTSPGQESSKVKYPVERFLTVYRSSLPDNAAWSHQVSDPYAYGKERLFMSGGINYDPSAAYSVTYLMLDKSPIVPFTGSYAANEKATLQELTDAVQQNATAVSVLMNKKTDKEAPGWITPTLLNGWLNFGNGTSNVAYIKDSLGFIHIKGRVKLGTLGWTPVFTLPPGHRPKEVLGFLGRGYTTQPVPCSIAVDSMGRVYVLDGTNTEAALDGVMFLAEQ